MDSLSALPVVLLALVLLSSGCAGGSGSSSSTPQATAKRLADSTTAKLAPGEPFPGTDNNAAAYGLPASPAVTHEVTKLVNSYYAAAAADDGTHACRLIDPPLSHSVAEDYGQAPGPPALRGKTCPVVMTKLFKHVAGQPSAVLAETKVTGVRVYRNNGFALLQSRAMPHGEIALARAGSAWRVEWLIGKEVHRP